MFSIAGIEAGKVIQEERTMRKNVLSVVLSICMAVTVLPGMAYAQENTDADSSKDTRRNYIAAEKVNLTKAGEKISSAKSSAGKTERMMNRVKLLSKKNHTGADLSLTKKAAKHSEISGLSNGKANETQYAAAIGQTRYDSLQDAIDAASGGDTVTLLDDVYNEGFLLIGEGHDADYQITIDLADHEICTYEELGTTMVLSGHVKLKNGIISNFCEPGITEVTGDGDEGELPPEEPEAAVAVYAENAAVDLNNVVVCTGEDNAIGVYAGENSKVTMDKCTYYGAFDITQYENLGEIAGFQACFADIGSRLTVKRSYIETNYGDGIVSAGDVHVIDSTVVTNQEEDGMIAEPYYSALASYAGGSIKISDGFYYGAPALLIADEDENGTSSAEIVKGELQAPEGCPAAANWFSDSDFGKRITIASGSMASPGDWKSKVRSSLFVYRNYGATAKVTAKLSAYSAVSLSWEEVKGAAGYSVYYKKASDRSYKLLGQTTGLAMKKTKLSSGVKYNFLVYSCDSLNYELVKGSTGKKNDIYTLKKIGAPSVSRKSSNYVTVKWTNIPGETGYQISRSSNKSKTNIVATFKTTSGKSRTVKAKMGMTYYYKVRAYALDSKGNKVYAPWSSVKSYKIK